MEKHVKHGEDELLLYTLLLLCQSSAVEGNIISRTTEVYHQSCLYPNWTLSLSEAHLEVASTQSLQQLHLDVCNKHEPLP